MRLSEFERCFQYALDEAQKIKADVRVELYRSSSGQQYRSRRGICFRVYDKFGNLYNSYNTGLYDDAYWLKEHIKEQILIIKGEM